MIQNSQAPKEKSKTGRLIANILCGAVAVAMLMVAVLLFVGRAQNRVTFIGNKAMIWILSGSMEPTIEERSYIRIERVAISEIRVGDVITFYSDDPFLQGHLNTHEVIGIIGEGEGTEFVTKGTNNAAKDAYTAKADKVVGRYDRSLPVLTALMRFFLTKLGLVTVLVLIASMSLALFLPDLLRYRREQMEKLKADLREEHERLLAEESERRGRMPSDAPDAPDAPSAPEASNSPDGGQDGTE